MWFGRIVRFLNTPLGRLVLLEIVKQVAPDLMPSVSSMQPKEFRVWLAKVIDKCKQDIIEVDRIEEEAIAKAVLAARTEPGKTRQH